MNYTRKAAIVLLWLGAMWALTLDWPEQLEGPRSTAAPSRAPDREGQWWGIYLQGHKIGYVQQTFRRSKDGTDFVQRSVLRMTTLGVPQTIRSTAWGSMKADFQLQGARLALVTGASTLEIDVSIEDQDVVVRTHSGGHDSTARITVGEPVFLPTGVRAAAFRPPLEVGRRMSGRTFDPLTHAVDSLHLEVVGLEALPGQPEVEAWRILENWRDMRSVLWVSSDGDVLREEGPMGLTAISEPQESAILFEEPPLAWDVIEALSVRVAGSVDEPRTRLELRVRLTGVAPDAVPVDDNQTFEKGVLIIKRANIESTQSYQLPYTGAEHADELKPTLRMQAANPRLRALARSVLGPERDARSATALLLKWVNEYLEKVPLATVPDALETLDRGSGDCTEHAVLLAALARAVGLPARMVAGIVYGDGMFLYHAWVEVWLGRWVPVDPALGQVPADATHVKLVVGEMDAHFRMMAIVGKLGVQLVDLPSS
jgi:hypothetical protein